MPDEDLVEAKRLLDSARVLVQRERAAAREVFARLHREWDIIKEQRRKLAPHHNLIRFLGFERSEVAFHPLFLCDLLDPNGSHDQGVLFLRSVLKLLGACRRPCGVQWGYQWRESGAASGSWLVLPERGRIDISIRNRDEGVLIFIENKIDAVEQEHQLCRYRERLASERHHYPYQLLVFLSPRTYGCPRTGTPDIHLTYEDDVVPWLKDVEGTLPATAITLRGNLQQYSQVVAAFGDSIMPSQDLIDLIVRPENLPWAIEISEAMEDAKTKLLRGFWCAIDELLRNRIIKLKIDDRFHTDGFQFLNINP